MVKETMGIIANENGNVQQSRSPSAETFGEVRNRTSNTSGHHCPVRPTHSFSARCVKQKHGGWCPECNHLNGWRKGCQIHGKKKEELMERPIKTPEDGSDTATEEKTEDLDLSNTKVVAEKPKLKCWRKATTSHQKTKKH